MNADEGGEGTKGIWLALGSYSFLIVLQLTAFLTTNVLVLLAQSLDRISDVLISIFFLISLRVSLRPPDPLHVFGHTRVQNVAALIVSSVLILYLSLETFRGAIPRLLDPSLVETTNLDYALAVTVASVVVIAIPSIVLMRKVGKGLHRAQLLNLLLDELSSGISLVAVVLIGLGYPIADPIGSILVGVAIVLTGVVLLRENVAILVGRAPGERFKRDLEAAARSVEGVMGVHGIRAEYVGPDTVHADLHIELAPEIPVLEADRIAHEVERRIEATTSCKYCEVHTGPFRPDAPDKE